MQFIFIDETGNSGFDLDNEEQPFHILFLCAKVVKFIVIMHAKQSSYVTPIDIYC